MNLKKLKLFFLLFLVFLTACSSSKEEARVDVQAKLLLSNEVVDVTINDNDYSIGNPNSEITMVEFTDYQCPFCGLFYVKTFPLLKENYIDTNKIHFVVKEFPLKNIHKHALNAALAAQCSGQQGKYTEMHNLLFTNQETWSKKSGVLSTFTDYAKEIELDIDSYITCMDSSATRNQVEASIQEAIDIGLTGTPSFVINGKIAKGAISYNTLAAHFDEILNNEE